MTLAALEATLRLYRDEKKAIRTIPTLRMLTMDLAEIVNRASRLAKCLDGIGDSRLEVTLIDLSSKAGGGALPLLNLPSKCLKLKIEAMSVNSLEQYMRRHTPPIIGRIEDDGFVLDPRTLRDDELPIIQDALETVLKRV
jgi:L-seryl-tRNA(Ser) seleniumtransferase